MELQGRKLLIENKLYRAYLDDVQEETGARIQDYLVVTPKNSAGSVSILPILGDKPAEKIGLIRIYRHAIREAQWEIPRGAVRIGESEADAARRELKEETGLIVQPKNICNLGLVTPASGILAIKQRLFAALDCKEAGTPSEPDFGHQEIQFFSPNEVSEMIRNEIIQDSHTILAWLLYQSPGFKR